MYLQSGHESEWLRQRRQRDQQLRKEISARDAATALTTTLAETQASPGRRKFKLPGAARWTRRLMTACVPFVKRPRGAAGQP